jgi:flagellar biosynthesis protein FlhA
MAAKLSDSKSHQPLGRFAKQGELLLAIGVIGVLIVLIIPLPSFLIDILITINIACSFLLLLTILYIRESLELSAFPSMLLFFTLYRLALNVATTRLILLNGYAGDVITSFGHFVVGGNLVVGFVVFLLLTVIQFIVIVKGSSRISEVAARFTLDAMPGKQMAIDADLNAGLITEEDAKERREKISKEAEFYGAMDGAAKFVTGDTIAGIIIIFINVIGGIVLGSIKGMGMAEAGQTYTILAIGDGLVSQIPSLIVATSAGILITKSSSKESLGRDITGQLFSQPKALGFAACVLGLFGFVPGLPKIPFFLLAALFGALYNISRKSSKVAREAEKVLEVAETEKRPEPQETVEKLLAVDRLGTEIGYKLIPLVDPSKGGGVLERINAMRRQLAKEIGIIIPPIRLRDNLQLDADAYSIMIRGEEVASGELMVGNYLALDPGGVSKQIEGTKTTDPAYGLPGVWVSEFQKEEAETAGYTIVDPASVLITHLTEVIKSHAYEILSREDVQKLIDTLKQTAPTIVQELTPNVMTIGGVQMVLKGLLREQVPIRDLSTILETIADNASLTKDTEAIIECVRQNLARAICSKYQTKDGKLGVISLDPQLEQTISSSIHRTEQGTLLALEPAFAQKLIEKMSPVIQETIPSGYEVVLLTSTAIRHHIRKLIEVFLPTLPVLSYKEIAPGVQIQSLGVVRL